MKIGFIFMLLSLALTNVSQSSTDGWRGLVPLKSSCEDVKRVLDVKKCEFPISSYEFPELRIVVYFSTCVCCERWRVGRGIIRSIGVYPLTNQHVDELNLGTDFKKVKDEEIIGGQRLTNATKGMTVYTLNGQVIEMIFHPPYAMQKLRCPGRKM